MHQTHVIRQQCNMSAKMVDPKTLSEASDSSNTGQERPEHAMNQEDLTKTDSANDSNDGSFLHGDIMPDLPFANYDLFGSAFEKILRNLNETESNDSRDGNPNHGDVMTDLMIQNHCSEENDANGDPYESGNPVKKNIRT